MTSALSRPTETPSIVPLVELLSVERDSGSPFGLLVTFASQYQFPSSRSNGQKPIETSHLEAGTGPRRVKPRECVRALDRHLRRSVLIWMILAHLSIVVRQLQVQALRGVDSG